MFEANAKPHDDFMNIKSLINHLRRVKTKKFILISTIAVYESFNSKKAMRVPVNFKNTYLTV